SQAWGHPTLLAVILTLAGCSGGSTPETPELGPSPPAGGNSGVPAVRTVTPEAEFFEPGAAVTFRADVTGEVLGWSWTFGAGTTPVSAASREPQVLLGTPGTYTGTLTLRGPDGPTAPFSFAYVVGPPRLRPPVVSAVSWDGQVAGTEGSHVVFQAVTTGLPTEWSWDFGGGAWPTTSTVERPFVVLGPAAPGLQPRTFAGSVTIRNALGTSPAFRFTYTVAPIGVPTIEAVGPALDAVPYGRPLTFIARATGNPTGWRWDFGGGMVPNISTDAHPLVEPVVTGDFVLTVSALNAAGRSPEFRFPYRVAVHPDAPVVPFVHPDGVSDWTGATHQFRAGATGGPPTSWRWRFGGGTQPTAVSTEVATVTFRSPGAWHGTVQLCNDAGCSEAFRFRYTITPRPPPPPPPGVQPANPEGESGAQLTMRASAPMEVVRWEWDFGGGAVPNNPVGDNPTVRLGDPGEYSCFAVAIPEHGGRPRVPFRLTVTASGPPEIEEVRFSWPRESGARVTVSGSATSGPTSWHWEFNGGAQPDRVTTTGQTSVILGLPGSYTGRLVATNDQGVSAPFEFPFTVEPPATLGWSTHALSGPAPKWALGLGAVRGRPAVASWTSNGKSLRLWQGLTPLP
ncbi:MAG TPA: PKD domain-containing protein, partial [bacterium]|nr:PKD domain-containing protein [bacterium]